MASPSTFLLVQGIALVLVGAVAVALALRGRRRSEQWLAVGIGATAWTVAVILKAACAFPLSLPLKHGLEKLLPKSVSDPLFWVYMGLLTGVFEGVIPLIIVSKSRLRRANLNSATAFGVGFGAIESIILGLVSLLVAAVLLLNILPADARAKVLASTGQVSGHEVAFLLSAVMERLSTLLIHCACCVLIVYAVRVRQWPWFWLSSAYKTLIDGFAAYVLMRWHVMQSTTRKIEFEAILLTLAVVTVPVLRVLKLRFAALETAQQSPEFSTAEMNQIAVTGDLG